MTNTYRNLPDKGGPIFFPALSDGAGHNIVASHVGVLDHFTFLGNFPPTPPLNQYFALSEK